MTPVTPADTLKNAPHCKNLPGSNFLNNDEAFITFLTTKPEVSSIPSGRKSDVYIVISHSQHEGRNNFTDDCVVRESSFGKTVNHDFVISEYNKLKTV